IFQNMIYILSNPQSTTLSRIFSRLFTNNFPTYFLYQIMHPNLTAMFDGYERLVDKNFNPYCWKETTTFQYLFYKISLIPFEKTCNIKKNILLHIIESIVTYSQHF
ncbi:hypothetical protein PanWU01x14_363330, partial [Parasponia andersonii]